MITIIFTVNGKQYSFAENLKSQVIEIIIRANLKIPVGSFKYDSKKRSVKFECCSNYSCVKPSGWAMLFQEYLKTAMAIYKSFGHAFILLIGGRTDLKNILKLCVERTDGMIANSDEIEDEQSSDDEDNSSDTEENETNKMNPDLQILFRENLFVSRKIKENSQVPLNEPLVPAIKLFITYKKVMTSIFIDFLRALYMQKLKFSCFQLEKIRVKFEN